MKRYALWVGVSAFLATLLPAAPAAAQGVTSAAVSGRVTDESKAPVDQALVTLINTSNGQRYSTRSGADGRFYFENAQVGGPYTLEVRALGFAPEQGTGITLTLGQRFVRDFSLKRTAVEVAGITVSANENPLLSPSRTGASGTVTGDVISRLPTLGRNFSDFVSTIPQVVSAGVPGTSLGGQNNRFNNIQIDGGVNNDLFGLAAGGTPGGQANAHPISVEAIKEYQVLIAPFDVRQGGFTGGLVNAVTKSGSNTFHGSLFGFLQNQGFVRDSVPQRSTVATGVPLQTDFTQTQYGGSISGPILRDRLQFFGSVDVQHRVAPFTGAVIGSDTTGGKDSVGIGIRYTTATRVQQILKTQYGLDAGGLTAPNIRNPDKNIFAKVNGEISPNHHAEVSYNYVDASQDVLTHNTSNATSFRDGYQLSNSGYLFATTTNTLRGKLASTLARGASNELLIGYQRIRDHRDLASRTPLIFVGGDRGQPVAATAVPTVNIAAGADRFSQGNLLNQDIYELTDNFTFPSGSHLITVGTHNEFFHFFNVFFPASYGVWSFRDTTALKAGTPFRYEIALPLRSGGPNADFHVQQLGGYFQDVWSPRPGLSVTLGLRLDVPFMNKPPANNALEISVLKVNTRNSPTGNALWSPRVGFNYDVKGDQSTIVRGGVGIFSGRPPYVWVSNAYSNTGLEQATLVCDGAFSGGSTDTVPRFRVSPDSQPRKCGAEGPGSVGLGAARPSIVYFDQGFKLPQNLKTAFGMDRQLPGGVVGTFDFLFTKGLNQFYMYDVNLQGIVGTSAGEGGRPLYGTISTTSTSTTPSRLNANFGSVLRHTNRSGDYSYSFTGQLQKRFSNGVQFNVGYTYARSYDLISLTSSIANSNYQFTPLDGPITARNLRPSTFDIPHKITASATFDVKFGVALSVVYTGQNGYRYGYVVSNDANGEGLGSNDLVYVPRDAADIALQTPADWTKLDAYIKNEPCLERNRGRILPRNSCQNPWMNFLNLRLAKAFTTVQGQNVELTADLFNTFSLLDDIGIRNGWGDVKTVHVAAGGNFENENLLSRTGYDTVNQRGIYALNSNSMPIKYHNNDAARWRLQVGMKYSF
ncbi:MAG: hypothetical protein DMD68_00105 [Gemmatimonadetes bacterium]|nr:MAG: hypothetical protein DMD68_00105 [Gemmatimonadota bacterium]